MIALAQNFRWTRQLKAPRKGIVRQPVGVLEKIAISSQGGVSIHIRALRERTVNSATEGLDRALFVVTNCNNLVQFGNLEGVEDFRSDIAKLQFDFVRLTRVV
jgi:hypothetical protein